MSYEKGFQRGDHLIVPIKKFGMTTPWMHHGIYCGDGMVVHYDEHSKSIKKVHLEKFSEGSIDEIHELYYSNPPFDQEQSAKNAEDLCENPRTYDLIQYNCEHIAFWCKTGIYASKQVETFLDNISILGTVGENMKLSRETGISLGVRTALLRGHPVVKVAGIALAMIEGAEYLLKQGKVNQVAAGTIRVSGVDTDGDGDEDYKVITV